MRPEDLLFAKTHEWVHVERDASGAKIATVGITGTRWVQGPVYARLELAAGSAATGGPLLPTRGWAVGVGAGLVVSTPFGSILVSGGLSSFGRSALLVQVGEH